MSSRDLSPPPVAEMNSSAVEVLRVWALADAHQQVTLRTTWRDPEAWGLLLVDIARHASVAYEREGIDRTTALERIRAGFDAEWSHPTDSPEDIGDAAG